MTIVSPCRRSPVHPNPLRALHWLPRRSPSGLTAVTTDQHPAYGKAIRWIIGKKVAHRRQQYLNNRTEQDHRGIKQRYYPMLGFKSFASGSRFCLAFDGLRQYLRFRRERGERVSLAAQRDQFSERWQALVAELAAA